MLVVALCIIGFFVYKKFFASSDNFVNNFDNFGNDNFTTKDNFGNDNNFGDNNNLGDNNLGDNFVADNFDKADLEILNMPVPSSK